MQQNLKFAFLAAAFIFVSASGSADASERETGWYAQASIGPSLLNYNGQDTANYLVNTAGWQSANVSYNTLSANFGVSGGYKFINYFALEGGVRYLGYVSADLHPIGSIGSGVFCNLNRCGHEDVDAGAFYVAGVGRLPVGDRVTILGKLGLSDTLVDSRAWAYVGTGGSSFYRYSWSTSTSHIAPTVGIGVEFMSHYALNFDHYDSGYTKLGTISTFSFSYVQHW